MYISICMYLTCSNIFCKSFFADYRSSTEASIVYFTKCIREKEKMYKTHQLRYFSLLCWMREVYSSIYDFIFNHAFSHAVKLNINEAWQFKWWKSIFERGRYKFNDRLVLHKSTAEIYSTPSLSPMENHVMTYTPINLYKWLPHSR